MKMSRSGKIALTVSEGIVDAAYLDGVKVWTIGIGHTKAAGEPDPYKLRGVKLTLSRIIEIFEKDLPDYEGIVNRNVKVPLSQQQFDALVHFAYNVGESNFRKSRLLRMINDKDYETAGKEGFHGWLKPSSIIGRRDKERRIFLNGKYGPTVAPYYTATLQGKTIRAGGVDLEHIWPKENKEKTSCSSSLESS